MSRADSDVFQKSKPSDARGVVCKQRGKRENMIMEQIKENKSYFIGMFITALIGAIAGVFDPYRVDLPIIVNVLGTTVTVVIMGFIISGLIVGISWIFARKFSFTRLVKISTIVCVVWTVSSILSTMLNLGGR